MEIDMKKILIASIFSLFSGSIFAANNDFVYKSRFGNFSMNSGFVQPIKIFLNGKKVKNIFTEDEVESIDFIKSFPLKNSDVLLFNVNVGQACPNTYHLVLINKTGVKTSDINGFGTCGELKSVQQNNEKIYFSIRGFAGPLEPERVQKNEYRKLYKFIFDGNKVIELKR